MDETRYNVALLEQVRDMVNDEGQHDQSLWSRVSRKLLTSIPDRWRSDQDYGTFIPVSCPTAACVAGWAATLSGGKMLVSVDELNYSSGSAEANQVLVDGEVHHISTYARKVLGLTGTEADALFDGNWTNEETLDNLDDIIRAAKHGREWEPRWHGEDD